MSNETEVERLARLDRDSRPLRDAVREWRDEHMFGGASRWDSKLEHWIFTIYVQLPTPLPLELKPEIKVFVAEDGSCAIVEYRIRGVENLEVVETRRKLKLLLNRILRWI